jgi:hypothetical protein
MKRMACGTAATLALVGLAACFSNPANDLNNDNFHVVQATPLMFFTKTGDSVQLRLRLVNDANNGTITSFTLGSVPAGIVVRYDDKFRPYYLNGADTLSVPVDKDMQQYYVKGVTPGKYTFTASATANTAATPATITVWVEAKDLGAALGATSGNAGDVLTITAPAGTQFTRAAGTAGTTPGNTGGSQVTWASGAASTTELVSADLKTLTVTLVKGQGGIATVTLVQSVITGLDPTVYTQTLPTTNALTIVP